MKMELKVEREQTAMSDAEVEAEIVRTIKAFENRPHLVRDAVKERLAGVVDAQVNRALDRLLTRSIVE